MCLGNQLGYAVAPEAKKRRKSRVAADEFVEPGFFPSVVAGCDRGRVDSERLLLAARDGTEIKSNGPCRTTAMIAKAG